MKRPLKSTREDYEKKVAKVYANLQNSWVEIIPMGREREKDERKRDYENDLNNLGTVGTEANFPAHERRLGKSSVVLWIKHGGKENEMRERRERRVR